MNQPLPHDLLEPDSEQPYIDQHWAVTLRQAQEKPWRYGFLSLMRRFSARYANQPPIGRANHPRQETFRLKQSPSMVFAPREIAEASLGQEGRFHLRLFSLGLWGANGPLPLHYTEIARNRREASKDDTLVDFADIFHHRYLTQFYHAWRISQSAAGGLDRAQDEAFSFYVASLTGQDLSEPGVKPLPVHARLAASAHLVREARNPDGLCASLAHYFGVSFHIQEYVLHWISVAPEERTQLGKPGSPSVMGESALVGQMVPDRQHKFRLVVGPLTLEQYLFFIPNGRDLRTLIEWIRAFTGYEYVWEIELQLEPHSAPPARMGDDHRLGWSTWLGKSMHDAPVTGMIFEPECYDCARN